MRPRLMFPSDLHIRSFMRICAYTPSSADPSVPEVILLQLFRFMGTPAYELKVFVFPIKSLALPSFIRRPFSWRSFIFDRRVGIAPSSRNR